MEILLLLCSSHYLIKVYHYNVRPRMPLQLAYLGDIYDSYARNPAECQTVHRA